MSATSDALLRSLRRWLLVAVFLLGTGVIALADIAYNVTAYRSGLVPAVVGVTGGVVALVAGLRAIGTLATASD